MTRTPASSQLLMSSGRRSPRTETKADCYVCSSAKNEEIGHADDVDDPPGDRRRRGHHEAIAPLVQELGLIAEELRPHQDDELDLCQVDDQVTTAVDQLRGGSLPSVWTSTSSAGSDPATPVWSIPSAFARLLSVLFGR